MMLIETYLEHSSIHGLGLFSLKNIKKGDKTWEWTPGIDIEISQDQFLSYTIEIQSFIKQYAWFNNDRYYLCADNAKFINHSTNPNITSNGSVDFAIKDISAGEELTCNYFEFHKGNCL